MTPTPYSSLRDCIDRLKPGGRLARVKTSVRRSDAGAVEPHRRADRRLQQQERRRLRRSSLAGRRIGVESSALARLAPPQRAGCRQDATPTGDQDSECPSLLAVMASRRTNCECESKG
jgi:hypothetical protein